MAAGHVPDGTTFATKPALAVGMIERVIAADVPFAWVAADSVYGIGDVEVVEPALSRDVPTRRQDNDLAIGKRGEVMLDTAIAQRIIDAVLLGLAGEIAFGDVKDAVALAQA